MKKLLFFVTVFVVLIVSGLQAYALDWMLANEKYLIEDDLIMTQGTAGGSGWDIHEVGGEALSDWGRYYLKDSSKYLPVDATRKFQQVTSGKIELEYRFYFTEDIEGFRWQVRNGENPVISLVTKGGSIYAEKPDNTMQKLIDYTVDPSLTTYTAATEAEYGVRISMDLDNKLYKIYINGMLCGDDIPMSDSTIDNLFFTTTAEGTGRIYIYPIRLYKDYYLNETFVSTKAGVKTLPSYMDASASGVTVESMTSQIWPDQYNLRISSTGDNDVHYAKNIDIDSDFVAFEFFVIDTDGVGGLLAKLGDSINITMDNGSFCFNGKPFYSNYRKDLWYRVKVIADYGQGLCDLYINNIKQAENVKLGGTGRNRVSFEAISGKYINTGIDDIAVYPMQPEPEDYVQTPKKANSRLDLGIISCSLWRNGKQFGWDRIAPWSERKPLLGWYDEGNPETSDWETKFMTEHGIDFEIFCWFKPDGSGNTSIKTPNWSYAIDAYKNSKYSYMMQYCLLYENLTASCKGIDDFKEHLVPYWIEHYFKDSRYYKIDNKPVFVIYDIGRFVNQIMGGIENAAANDEYCAKAKEAIDYLRAECEKAGFDGCIVMASYSAMGNLVSFDTPKKLGIDAICPYGWDQSNGSSANFVKEKHLEMIDNGLDLVPMASMGFDSEAWGGAKGTMTNVEEFTEMCRWINKEFTINITNGKYGKKMAVIDNWNEIGEGHFICPSEGHGFAYLDAIREMFADGAEHEDILPTENQGKRMRVLYDQSRPGYKMNTGVTTNRYPTKVVLGWYFNTDTESWDIGNAFSSFDVTDGALHLVSGGGDPIITSPKFNVDASSVSYIKIRFKRSADSAAMSEFFFTTDTSPTMVWYNTYRINTSANEFNEVYIKVSDSAGWNGKITQLRFDPVATIGEAWIDSIEFLGEMEDSTDAVVVDGDIQAIPPEMIGETECLPLVNTVKNFNDKAVFDWNTDNEEELQFVIDNNAYVVKAGESTYLCNNVTFDLGKKFVMKEGIMYAPAQFIAKVMNALNYSYNPDTNTVYISIKPVSWTVENGGLNQWSANGNLYQKRDDGKSIAYRTKAYEAVLTSPDGIGIKAGRISKVTVKYKNATSTSSVKLYYRTKNSPQWSGDKVTVFKVNKNDKNLTEYTIPVDWKGDILEQIKLVVSNKVGGIEIEGIELEY